MRHTFQRKTVNTVFKVRNIASDHRTIHIFTHPILWNNIVDLLNIPEISESDIRHSLLKGELKGQANNGTIEVIECTIDLTQFDSEQKAFLQSLGVGSGIALAPDAVANISELGALDDALFDDGTALSMLSVRDIWQLNKTSSDTVDGITIINTNSGTGRWIRKELSDKSWTTQTTWYINPTSGNDENSGVTQVLALKTLSELARRWRDQLIDVLVIVRILSSLAATDIPRFRFNVGENGFVLIKGIATEVATGTFTAVTELDAATNQPNEVTDSGLSDDWENLGYVEKRLRLTSGSNVGAVAWVAKDLGSKAARVSSWLEDSAVDLESLPWEINFDHCEAAVGDDYVIEDLPNIADLVLEVQPLGPDAGKLVIEDLNIKSAGRRTILNACNEDMRIALNRCDLGDVNPGPSSALRYVNCLMVIVGGQPNTSVYIEAGMVSYYVTSFVGCTTTFMGGTLVHGGIWTQGGDVWVFGGGVCVMETGSYHGIELVHSSKCIAMGPIFGDADTGFGVKVHPAASMEYGVYGSTKPTITGAAGDVEIGGVIRTWAEVPFINEANNAMIVDFTTVVSQAVPDVAGLKLLSDAQLPDAYTVGMASVSDQWQLSKSDTQTPDDITIVAASIGNWLRLCTPGTHWTTQTDFYIDPVAGDDEGDGAVGTPLKTLSELARRWHAQVIDVLTTVHILGDTPASDYPRFRFTIGDNGFVLFKGVASTLFESAGTITGVVNRDPPTNQPNELTIPISGSWTDKGYIGKRVCLTSGSNIGAAAWAVKDLGSDTARMSPWYTDTTVDLENLDWDPYYDNDPCEAEVGDDYVVEDLTSIQNLDLDVHVSGLPFDTIGGGRGGIRLVFEDLEVTPVPPPGPVVPIRAVTIRVSGDNNSWALNRCLVGAVSSGADSVMMVVNCFHQSSVQTGVCSTYYYGGYIGGFVYNLPGRVIFVYGGTLNHGGFYCQSGEVHVTWGSDGLCIMETGSSPGIDLSFGALCTAAAPVYGDAGTGVGVSVSGGGRFIYDPGYKPTITGTGGDAEVAGTTKAWAEIPFADIATLAGIVLGDAPSTVRTDWYIDPVSGDDANDGAQANPLKTLSELARKWRDQVIDEAVTVHILSDLATTDIARFRFSIGDDGFVLFKGTATEVATGSLTAVTERNPAGNQPNEVTDTGLSDDWGTLGYVEKRLRLTSGSNIGAVAWVAKDLGSKAARTSSWVVDSAVDLEALPWWADVTNCEAAVSDDYVLEDLPSITDLSLDVTISGLGSGFGIDYTRLILEDLSIRPADGRLIRLGNHHGENGLALNRCDLGYVCPGPGVKLIYTNCCIENPLYVSSATGVFVGGLVLQWLALIYSNTVVGLHCATLVHGGILVTTGQVYLGAGGACVMETGSYPGVELRGSAVFVGQDQVLFGDADTGIGVVLYSACQMSYISAKPTLTGSGGDAEVGGDAKNWAEIPYFNVTNGAGLVE